MKPEFLGRMKSQIRRTIRVFQIFNISSDLPRSHDKIYFTRAINFLIAFNKLLNKRVSLYQHMSIVSKHIFLPRITRV